MTAIRNRMFEPVVVHVGSTALKEAEPAVNLVPPLAAGYETRAECFGELVFLRARAADGKSPEVECPLCGTWCELLPWKGLPRVFCKDCHTQVAIRDMKVEEGWVGVRAYDLLSIGNDKYFLPRRWNPYGKWITYKQLGEMLNKYNEETSCTR